jgi:hypothetical protein
MTVLTEAKEPCGCGCACCDGGGPPKPKEEEIAELRRLRDAIDARLGELKAG